MTERGNILVEEAYAQGKMLNHAAWCKGEWKMPRNITPSDIDFAIDNDGKVLFCELNSSESEWAKLGLGQRLLYRNLIFNSAHLSVLCKHSVPKTKKINTRHDVESFQVLVYSTGNKYPNGYQTTRIDRDWETKGGLN